MSLHTRLAFTLIALLLCGCAAPAQRAPAADRSPDAMLAEYDALHTELLRPEKLGDLAYRRDLEARQNAFATRRAALAQRFYARHPGHPRAGEMLVDRWRTLSHTAPQDALRETQAVIDRVPPVPARADALYVKAILHFTDVVGGPRRAAAMDVVDELVRAHPNSPRGPELLKLVIASSKDPAERNAARDRLARDFPDALSVRVERAIQRRAQAIGQPFELSFTDAITGRAISTADLKGKVVVIDFWATWCAPCLAEMPTLKRLYAAHQRDGLEILGVSLDVPEKDGGLQRMKAVVEQLHLPWPQYYQGDGWESAFSSGWGVMQLPATFVVDRLGNLHTLDGHGKLEQLLPALLKAPRP